MSKYAWAGMIIGFIFVWYILKMDALMPGIIGGCIGAAIGGIISYTEKSWKKLIINFKKYIK